MSKQQLILSNSDRTSFEQVWLRDILDEYFDMVFIEHDPIICDDGIIVTNVINEHNTWYHKLLNNGHKLIVDNLWEQPKILKHTNALCLTNTNWFWYNESLWYRHLGYHTHVSNPNISKNGLLLMNLKKPHRDDMYNKLDKERLLYSYVGIGQRIHGDIDETNNEWQRYFNPDWYNSTAFSLVAETTVQNNKPQFITEKTFKPIAFQHPFLIYGQSGVLQYLHQQGFETFENMFDESYDTDLVQITRLRNIVDQANQYVHNDYDSLTLEKLKHNKILFFNHKLVKERIIKEIIHQILEYAET